MKSNRYLLYGKGKEMLHPSSFDIAKICNCSSITCCWMRISSFFPAPHLTFYIFLILIEAWNISKEGVEILELLKENCHKKILFSDKNCDERSGESRILDRKIDRLGKQEKCKTLFAKHSFKDTESKLAWTLQTYFKWALKTSRVCFFRDRARSE